MEETDVDYPEKEAIQEATLQILENEDFDVISRPQILQKLEQVLNVKLIPR
jgi:hypothetical protein